MKLFDAIHNAWKKKFCSHIDLEVAFEISDVKHSYNVLCPLCERKITINTIGYTLKPDKTNRVCSKRVYRNKKDAETVMNWCRSQGRKKQPERIYACPKCNGWHLTSQKFFAENINAKLK